jgi:cytokinin riboside 5'-monophosphate phosphoribohydrolase
MTTRSRHVCVYCSSSAAVDDEHVVVARALGAALGARGDVLVWGGATVGLMGEVARATRLAGGRTIGVIPESLRAVEIADHAADELVVTTDMLARKGEMAARADAFVALPGGFGTLEELLEQITARLLGFHDKPIVLVDVGGFWQPLLALFEHLYRERFARPESAGAYTVVTDVVGVLAALDAPPVVLPGKWLPSPGTARGR